MTMLDIPVHAGINDHFREIDQYMHRLRIFNAFMNGRAAFPIYRKFPVSVRMDVDDFFDHLAGCVEWVCERTYGDQAILTGEGFMARINATINPTRLSLMFTLRASSLAIAERVKNRIMTSLKNHQITDPMFSLIWTFADKKGDLNRVNIEEIADDECLDAAYPMIQEGLSSFIDNYLSAPETVLVLQGPPGTGKTRLIRHILGAESRQKRVIAKAVYTTDQNAMLSDNLFVNFITGSERFLIIEDADHILRSREDGNEVLHRFLAIADGVVSAQGRKIIFTTNLPKIGDIDAALVRPGRCFGHRDIRELSLPEATALVVELGERHGVPIDDVIVDLVSLGTKTYSLAEVFRRFRRGDKSIQSANVPPKRQFGFVS